MTTFADWLFYGGILLGMAEMLSFFINTAVDQYHKKPFIFLRKGFEAMQIAVWAAVTFVIPFVLVGISKI